MAVAAAVSMGANSTGLVRFPASVGATLTDTTIHSVASEARSGIASSWGG